MQEETEDSEWSVRQMETDWIFYGVIVFWVILALFVLWVIAYYIGKNVSVKRLKYKRYFSEEGVFEGEEVYLYEVLENHSIFPMFSVNVESYVTSKIQLEGVKKRDEITQHFISYFRIILPFTKIVRKHKATCMKRGYYKLETAYIHFAKMDVYADSVAQIYVYPKELPVEEQRRMNYYLQYTAQTNIPLIEDAFSVSGIRQYASGDAMRHINHKATAKKGELMVNQMDYLLGRKVMIYVNFQMEDRRTTIEEFEELMEKAISMASYLFMEAIREGNMVGFCANSRTVSGQRYVRYPQAAGNQHYIQVLRNMATIQLIYGNSFASVIEMDIAEGMSQTECYMITTYVDEAVDKVAQGLEQMGNYVQMIMV